MAWRAGAIEAGPGGHTGAGSSTLKFVGATAILTHELKGALSGSPRSVSEEGEKLTLIFPENIYAPGEIRLSDTRMLDALLLKFEPKA